MSSLKSNRISLVVSLLPMKEPATLRSGNASKVTGRSLRKMSCKQLVGISFICGHVHDELIIECSMDVSLKAVCEQMKRTPPWMKGLALRADGYETMFYKKD